MRFYFFQHFHFSFSVFITSFGFFANTENSFVGAVHIRQYQFHIDGIDIVSRINFIGNVDDVFILKTTHYMADGISFADIGQKLIAKALSF